MRVKIIDTTLRDGEQAPGVSFTVNEKLHICEKLISIGINEIEAGIPVVDKSTFDFIKILVKLKPSCEVSTWCRLNEFDIRQSILTGVERIHISVPSSIYHLNSQVGSEENIYSFFDSHISLLRDNFGFISVGLQDTFRANTQYVKSMTEYLENLGINRIRVSDTVGSSFPNDIQSLIYTIRSYFSGSVDFHGHNDFGLATANTLAAIDAGADSVNVTVNGLGERAGNTPLEEIAVVLNRHKTYQSNIKISELLTLCEMVSVYSHRDIPVNKPITGDLVFTHESGIHCRELFNNPLSYQPFNPELLGNKHSKIVIGSHSGKSSVKNVLNSAGLNITNSYLPKITKLLKERSRAKKDFLTQQEIETIYYEEMRHVGNTM